MTPTKETIPLKTDPFEQLAEWVHRAIDARLPHPDAMSLATVSASGQPSSRIVLLKEIKEGGLWFFTNYESRKGEELATNPKAAATFFWPTLDLQVRVRGTVEKLTRAQSEAYFRSRPRGSQIGAWASRQSCELASRSELEARVTEFERKFQGKEVPCPEHWGGYTLKPDAFEFWIAHPDRLHDRFLYERTDRGWNRARLSP